MSAPTCFTTPNPPVDIGVFDDLTTRSATSSRGIIFRRPVGAEGRELGPGEGEENILSVSVKDLASTHIHTVSAIPSRRLSVLLLFNASWWSKNAFFGRILSRLELPTDEPREGPLPDRALIRSIMARRRSSIDPVLTTLPLSFPVSSRTNGSSSSFGFGTDVKPGPESLLGEEKRFPEDAGPR